MTRELRSLWEFVVADLLELFIEVLKFSSDALRMEGKLKIRIIDLFEC